MAENKPGTQEWESYFYHNTKATKLSAFASSVRLINFVPFSVAGGGKKHYGRI